MIGLADPTGRRRDGFDVAYVAVWTLGLFLTVMVLCITGLHVAIGSSEISDGLTQVLIAGVGALSTVAGAALGYQVGSRSPRRSTDPDGNPPIDPTTQPTPAPAPMDLTQRGRS